MVGVFGMAEPAGPQGERLVAALRDVVEPLGQRGNRTREDFSPASSRLMSARSRTRAATS